MATDTYDTDTFYDVDETTTRLKGSLDVNDLMDPQGKGVEFEVEDDEVKKEGETEENTDFTCFDKNQVASSICLLSDAEDENESDEYLTEMECLQKKMRALPDSDITSKKDGGILKQMKTTGVGPVIPENSLVRIHYNAYTEIGQPPYDSTHLRNESRKVRLGKSENIPGFEMAILTMRKHEVSRFLIRYDYAYGEMGCPPRIPKKAFIIMDIQVLHYVEQEGVDDYYSMTSEERRERLTFEDIQKVVNAENSEGKEYFAVKNYQRAYSKFKRSITILEGHHNKNAPEEKVSNNLKIKAYVNAAICSYHLCHFSRVIGFCSQVLQLDKHHIKALYYKGKALHSVGDFDRSEYFLKLARNVDSTNMSVSKALKSLAKSKKDHEIFEKQMYKRMFPQSGSTTTASTTAATAEKETNKSSSTEISTEEEEKGTCSDGFKEIAQSALQTFKEDPSRKEMVFPPIHMNIAEIHFLVETAADLNLDVRSKGTGNSLRHEFYKKPK